MFITGSVLIWALMVVTYLFIPMIHEGVSSAHWGLLGLSLSLLFLALLYVISLRITPVSRVVSGIPALSFIQQRLLEPCTPLTSLHAKILEHVPMSIMTCDQNGNVTSVNSYYSTLSGKDMDMVIGQNILEKRWINLVNLKEKYIRLLHEGVPFREFGCEYVSDEGVARYLDVMAVPLRDNKGHIRGAISMAQDSTRVNAYHEKMIAQTEQLNIINKVTKAINSTLDISEIVWTILRNTVKIFGPDTECTIAMVEGGSTVIREAYPPKFNDGTPGQRPRGEGIVGHAIATKQSYCSNNVKADPYYIDSGRSKTASELVVPVLIDGEVIGAINIESTKLNKFSSDDIELVQTLSNHMAVAMRNARLYEDLHQSEEKFRSLVNEAITGVYIIQDGLYKYTNPEFQKMFGFTEEELVNKPFQDLIAPKQRERFKGLTRESQFGGLKEREYFSLQGVTKDGRVIDVEGKFTYAFYNGSSAVQGYIVDVTKTKRAVQALRESEKKYSDLVERAHDGIVIIQEEQFVFANKAFIQLFGRSEQDVVGNSCYEFLTPDSQDKLKEFFGKTIEERLSSPILELVATCKNRARKFVTCNVGMIEYLGKPAYILVIRDDTKRKRLEENIRALNKNLERKVMVRTDELRQANDKLQEAVQLKSQFIANSSHELRTPLTIIKGNLELALRAKKMGDINYYLETINSEVDYMTRILSDLSVLTKADSLETHGVLSKQLDLDEVIAQAIKSTTVLAFQKGITITFDLQKKSRMWGNKEYLEQLITNLISNAVKYGKREIGIVDISLKKVNSHLQLIVKDNGIGIKKQELQYIFERFYRSEKARQLNEQGSGLGLSICQWIVHAHKGTISVESQEGEGTTFFIDFPGIDG